jgi:hypothetical protein
MEQPSDLRLTPLRKSSPPKKNGWWLLRGAMGRLATFIFYFTFLAGKCKRKLTILSQSLGLSAGSAGWAQPPWPLNSLAAKPFSLSALVLRHKRSILFPVKHLP